MEPEKQTANLDQAVASLCDRVEYLLTKHAASPQERLLIALAGVPGVPGSGKSTISRAVVKGLAYRGTGNVVIVPMDGFHYPRAVLSTFDDPLLALQKRGAPFTFDSAAFLKLILQLYTTPVTAPGDHEVIIRAPSFDHAKQDPIADDIEISSMNKIVIVEGNYTLLNEAPWDAISSIVHDSWFVDVPPETAKQRLVERHIEAGIEQSRAAAACRVEDNDIPNGEYIRSRLIQPNITIIN